MKKPVGVLLVSLSIAANAYAEGSALEFQNTAIDPLPHSLLEDAAQRLPLVSSDFGQASQTSAANPRIVWHMPIISPSGGIDPKILKLPDSSTDYKLIVNSRDAEPVK